MRIPTNSNFTKEITKDMNKKLQRIINPQTTLEELQNLQDEMKMINPVDTHLLNQVSQLKEKANGQETSKVANAVRQVHNERKGFVTKTVSTKGKEKSYSLETTSN
jgi:Asp/Glu/hydantoin racemase